MMKLAVSGAALVGLLLFAAAQARGGAEKASARPAPTEPTTQWGELAARFGGASRSADRRGGANEASAAEVDVVDAHWMALTMWGEARGDGEEGMRAVGHVIDNRRRAGHRSGRYVTDTVSAAWQFSCWNAGDPNHRAILELDRLPADSHDRRMGRLARRLADEILAGRSPDPTGGALFYHATGVAPAWSEGVPVARQIGRHFFFRTAR